MTEKGITIKIVETECSLCGKKIRAITEEQCTLELKKHVTTDCKTIQTIEQWDALGVRQEMISLMKYQELDSELRRLIKKYKFTIEEIVEAAESIGGEKLK
jgi:predicted amidophosphoribosyltransferase